MSIYDNIEKTKKKTYWSKFVSILKALQYLHTIKPNSHNFYDQNMNEN